jgi:rRNA maturation endonuclease Nob1
MNYKEDYYLCTVCNSLFAEMDFEQNTEGCCPDCGAESDYIVVCNDSEEDESEDNDEYDDGE